MSGPLSRVIAGSPARSVLSNPEGWIRDLLVNQASYTGKKVNVESALQLIPVYAAVNRISGAIGSLPLVVYRERGDTIERVPEHRAYGLLHDEPNAAMAADELWALVTAFLATWGNAFLIKGRNKLGLVDALWPISPSRMTWEVKSGQLVYYCDGAGPFTTEDIIHIRRLSPDGRIGYSPITLARQGLGNAMAQEEYQGRLWANNARPSGVLRTDKELSERAAQRLKRRWEAAHGGLANAAKVAVLEEGLEWQSIGLPAQDAQFIEQMEMSNTQIALLFGLPPSMLAGKTNDSLTYATTEGHALDFVKFCLQPYMTRIEKSLGRDRSLFIERKQVYPKFLADGLLRGDTKSRYEAYSLGFGKWLTRNDIRRREDLNPVEGGDEMPTVAEAMKSGEKKPDDGKEPTKP